jgi:hypothetical protein
LTWHLLSSFLFMNHESRWWYPCDRDSERLLISMLLLQANPSLSQSNGNRHSTWRQQTTNGIYHLWTLAVHELACCHYKHPLLSTGWLCASSRRR